MTSARVSDKIIPQTQVYGKVHNSFRKIAEENLDLTYQNIKEILVSP